MGLTKNQGVMKALVEEMLRRNHRQHYERPKEDVVLGLKVLNTMLPEGRVFVIADSSRLAEGFAAAIGRPWAHIDQPERTIGMRNVHFVVLHTGDKTPNQRLRHAAVMEAVERLGPGPVTWHVGEWRV